MKGYRKVIISLIIIAVAALVPLNPNQANVLIAVAVAMLTANAVSNVGGRIAEEMGKRNYRRFKSVTPVSWNPEKPWQDGPGYGEDPRQDVTPSEWDRGKSW